MGGGDVPAAEPQDTTTKATAAAADGAAKAKEEERRALAAVLDAGSECASWRERVRAAEAALRARVGELREHLGGVESALAKDKRRLVGVMEEMQQADARLDGSRPWLKRLVEAVCAQRRMGQEGGGEDGGRAAAVVAAALADIQATGVHGGGGCAVGDVLRGLVLRQCGEGHAHGPACVDASRLYSEFRTVHARLWHAFLLARRRRQECVEAINQHLSLREAAKAAAASLAAASRSLADALGEPAAGPFAAAAGAADDAGADARAAQQEAAAAALAGTPVDEATLRTPVQVLLERAGGAPPGGADSLSPAELVLRLASVREERDAKWLRLEAAQNSA